MNIVELEDRLIRAILLEAARKEKEYEKERVYRRREYIARRLRWMTPKSKADLYCLLLRRGCNIEPFVRKLKSYTEKQIKAMKMEKWEGYEYE